MTGTKKLKVEFAPGCFDAFDGSQEELDELIQAITKMAESGELSENARVISDEEFFFELPDEVAAQLNGMFDVEEKTTSQRNRKLN
jgi:hypothetical protein